MFGSKQPAEAMEAAEAQALREIPGVTA
jgi:hypothetical protein